VIADLRPYPQYQELGLPWLGRVPGHWEARRLRHVCEMRVSNVDKHTTAGETRVRLCNYVDVYKNERIRESMPFMSATATEDERFRFRLRISDVLITKDSEEWNDIGVPSLVEFEAPDLVCGYHLAILRPRPGLHGAFLHRALQCYTIAVQLHVEANGVTRYGLSHGAIQGISIPFPPPEEQAAIVQFLNWANGRLDRLIRAKRKVITLLNEQKQAIIHRAVNRGLDLSVSLKPSGIAWLGDIPQHWELRRIKYLLREVDERSTTGSEPLLSMRMHHGLVLFAEHFSRPPQAATLKGFKIVRPGQFVVNRMQAGNGVIFASTLTGLVSPDYAVFDPLGDANVDFLGELFRSRKVRAKFRAESKGLGTGSSGFLRLYNDRLGAIHVALPPRAEQCEILTRLAGELSGLKSALSRLEREVELLREYRTRLVADVVTGKLDVRDAAARLPEETVLDTIERSADPSDEAESADEEVAA
jgi:type I restriction enzyme, S subunit